MNNEVIRAIRKLNADALAAACLLLTYAPCALAQARPHVNAHGGTYLAVIRTDDFAVAAIDSRITTTGDSSGVRDDACKITLLDDRTVFLSTGTSDVTDTLGRVYFTMPQLAKNAYVASRGEAVRLVATANTFSQTATYAVTSLPRIPAGVNTQAISFFIGTDEQGALRVMITDNSATTAPRYGEISGSNEKEPFHSAGNDALFDEMINGTSPRAIALLGSLERHYRPKSKTEVAATKVVALVQAMIDWGGVPTIGGKVAAVIIERGQPVRWFERPAARPSNGIGKTIMANKTQTPRASKKPKLTDAERRARFIDTARMVEVDESPEAFDRAFEKVVRPIPKPHS